MTRAGFWVALILGGISLASSSARAQTDHSLAVSDSTPAPAAESAPRPSVSGSDRATPHALGIVMAAPYTRGKVPVVLVHGLWATRGVWNPMITALRADPELDERFQFWTFGYATGNPIPYAAWMLRRELDQTRQVHDPAGTDAAWDRMVIVGHSMGGLLAKMMVVETGDELWRCISPRRPADLQGDRADVATLLEALRFNPRPEVARVVFIATPHAGSNVNAGSLHRLGNRLLRVNTFPAGIHDRLLEANDPDFFTPLFQRGISSSVDELRVNGPILTSLHDLPLAPRVQGHSIIAVRTPALASTPTDGLVTLTSARLDRVASEKIVTSPHLLCIENAEVVAEVQRILHEHLAPR